MPGTRTATDPSTTDPTSTLVSLHLIDASGDLYVSTVASTDVLLDADIEDWANEYALVSNASLYKISIQKVYEGDADPDNAVADYRGSVKDGINLLYRDIAANVRTSPRLVAPIAATMQGNQDIPLLSGFATFIAATKLLLGTGFELVSAQFTERRERSNNPRIKA